MLTGEPMQRLFDRIAQDLPKGREAFAPEYHVYPPELDGAYEQRRRGVGEDMYGALQISREEKGKRLMWFANNFRAFGAPVLMLVHHGPDTWAAAVERYWHVAADDRPAVPRGRARTPVSRKPGRSIRRRSAEMVDIPRITSSSAASPSAIAMKRHR